jgi:hypothetical protein
MNIKGERMKQRDYAVGKTDNSHPAAHVPHNLNGLSTRQCGRVATGYFFQRWSVFHSVQSECLP